MHSWCSSIGSGRGANRRCTARFSQGVMKSRDGPAVPPLANRPQPLGNKGRRHANCVCDFYLPASIEFQLHDPLISPIEVAEEGLPVQSGPDDIDDRPATSPIAENAIEVLGIFANFRQADVGADTLSRRACFRHRVQACRTSQSTARQYATGGVPGQIACAGLAPSTASGLVRMPRQGYCFGGAFILQVRTVREEAVTKSAG
jgi:hypothetical protein